MTPRRSAFLIGFIFLSLQSSVNGVDIVRALTPSPLSIALTVGEWLLEEERKTYYVQVEATADSVVNARTEAFRLAVEMAIGTLVVSETEVKDSQLVRAEILKYSSGYIDNFKVLSESKVGNQIRLVVDVWVGESKIADRILNKSVAIGAIDGERVSVQQRSLKQVKQDAIKLIELVARDFPENAFDVSLGKTVTQVNASEISVDVPVTIKWSPKYLSALLEVIERTKDGESRSVNNSRGHQLVLSYRTMNGWIDKFASYSEMTPGYVFLRNFIESEPVARVTFRDDANKVIDFNCRKLNPLKGVFYGDAKMIVGNHSLSQLTGQFFAKNTPTSHFGIYGDYVVSGTLRTVIRGEKSAFTEVRKIDVDIVRKIECDAADDSFEAQMKVALWCRANKGNGKDFCPKDLR